MPVAALPHSLRKASGFPDGRVEFWLRLCGGIAARFLQCRKAKGFPQGRRLKPRQLESRGGRWRRGHGDSMIKIGFVLFLLLVCCSSIDVEAQGVATQKGPAIKESTRKPVAVTAAPEECLETFRQFFRYVQRTEPSIVKDETAQKRWLSNNLREALKKKLATFTDSANDPDFPGNGTFVGTWDSPTTFTIVGSRRYDKRAVLDIWYTWGKGTNYPGDTRLSYFVFVLEDSRWKLDDVYTFRGEYASAESLNAYLTSK